nr:CBS domain-containing protein [Halorientalis pallida]
MTAGFFGGSIEDSGVGEPLANGQFGAGNGQITDIRGVVTRAFVAFGPDTSVSTLVGTVEDHDVQGAIVEGDAFEGVVTRRQLVTSRRQPNEKLRSLAWSVPRLGPDEDVHDVARLMIDSDTRLLPVSEDAELVGVVTADDILAAVQSSPDAATVGEAATRELITLTPDTAVSEALHRFRENRIAHLPVVDDGSTVGIPSLYDVTDLGSSHRARTGAGTPAIPTALWVRSRSAPAVRGAAGSVRAEVSAEWPSPFPYGT